MIKGLIVGVYVTGVFQKAGARVQGSKTWQSHSFFLARLNDHSVNGNSKCSIKTKGSITCIRIKCVENKNIKLNLT